MEEIKRILVVSRMTMYCRKAVHYGVSLAKTYGAELYVLHVVHDPFMFGDWNLPLPNLDEEYKKTLQEAKEEIHKVVTMEIEKGVRVKELIKGGKPTEEILKTVEEEHIDLIILLAHEEGHLEHFLFGRSNEAIIQKMPCSVLLVKKEPEPVAF